MELLLLKLVALSRPLISMRYGEAYFTVLGVGLFGILVATLLVRGAVTQSLRLSSVDALVLAFTGWAVATFLIYFDGKADNISELPKVLIPLLSYTIVKNVIPNRQEYRRLLVLIIAGFAVPTLLSTALIAIRNSAAVDMEMYWTGLLRWQGAYGGAHSLGHSMTLFLVVLVIYVMFREPSDGKRRGGFTRIELAVLGLLGAAALFCLYKSQVRSAVLGLLVFAGLFGYLHNKKALLFGGVALAVVAMVTAPYWIPALLHEFAPDRRGGTLDPIQLGSGRPRMWLNDITTFFALPIDQLLGGAGFGSRVTDVGVFEGHNDWLIVLTRTGFIGVILFASLQIAILRKILRFGGRERSAYLALFVAVNLMMAVSNSYLLRIQVSHLYYMILAFIEIPPSRDVRQRNPVKVAA